jgi:dTDP-4-amino-4,6-dideoxygalactose transaminase
VATVLETRLKEWFNRNQCVPVGRATTGLGVLFEALDLTEVIFPAFCCSSPVYSTEYGDAQPKFCEVQSDYNISPVHLREEISANTDAVVACDTWGKAIDERQLQSICSEYDALLVEDAAQAVGSQSDSGSETGSLGDVSILSFGSGKPIDAGKGGAILTDDPDVAAACRTVARRVPVREESKVTSYHELHNKLYWAIAVLKRSNPSVRCLIEDLPRLFECVYWRGFDRAWMPTITDALDSLEQRNHIRNQHFAVYRSAVDHPDVSLHPMDSNTVPFSVALKLPNADCRPIIRKRLAERGFDTWWIEGPITPRFGAAERFPVSERLFEVTLNLPLGPEYGIEHVRQCATTLNQLLHDII